MKVYDTKGHLITTAEGNIKSYDTGWIACSDWTDQHLGTTVGGNVTHNLDTPLRNLNVKVFISTNGTDANSFEVGAPDFDWTPAAARNFGIVHYAVDNNNILIHTGQHGITYVSAVGGGIYQLDNESWYYRIVVYKMNTVYSGVTLDYYETPWIQRFNWTNAHLGDTGGGADSNVNHALAANLSALLIKVLVSPDGTDNNSFEIPHVSIDSLTPASTTSGLTIYQVDINNIKVQTGYNGVSYIQDNGLREYVDTDNWYYKIKVYKMTAVPPAIITSRVRVTKDDAQSIPHATVTIVEFDDVEYDSLGEWASNKFTAKNAGYYSVKAAVALVSVAWDACEQIILWIYKNGALYSVINSHQVEAAVTVSLKASGADDVYLNGSTDYIDIRMYQTQDGAVALYTLGEHNHVAIHRSS